VAHVTIDLYGVWPIVIITDSELELIDTADLDATVRFTCSRNQPQYTSHLKRQLAPLNKKSPGRSNK